MVKATKLKCECIGLVFLFILTSNLKGQSFLQIPIEGNQGNEWVIVNYVDWEFNGFQDYNCGTKSYDGHQGTDFVIRSFRMMDDSIAVLAASDGVVTYTIDSLYDRETDGDTSKYLGNYIAIRHPNKYYTYYAHLQKNSIQVGVGDSVLSGDIIGYVGSSGNSTDPHLHFEVWYDSMYVIDPLSGPCGNIESLFLNPPVYDTSLVVWESGIHLIKDLNINQLRERKETLTRPYTISTESDSSLYFWSHLYGLRKGKELFIEWYDPENLLWFEYSYFLDKDYWYYYYWTFIDHKNLKPGLWHTRLFYDGLEIAVESFRVEAPTSTTNLSSKDYCGRYESMTIQQIQELQDVRIHFYDSAGRLVGHNRIDADVCTPGIYFIELQKDERRCVLKKWVSQN